ncbi:glucose 1-dehydrogenase [Methylobacterium planeticum]|uniref:Glucose 1-dehydrogenase n=1 Tax=Methylobacterium planeticum TaxID=2615211 RepID=A0A6N6MZI7_9HYPH|nr:glucose 1-dehydrogenase [Methylobacterium planeticum]KAB1075980.1 glucose 1-dehydrogenase [Methylobacterium planeticum]
MSKLNGKVAVVTGASKGIGAGIAKAFAAEGAAVVVNYAASREGADRVVRAITEAGGRAVAVQADVARRADVERLFAETKAAFGAVDILVNNAGVYRFAPIEDFAEDEFDRQFGTNVKGLLLATQQAVAAFGPEGGSIINIGSAATQVALPATAVYTATKAAVDSITRVLSKELGPRRIRINTIAPGGVETEGVHDLGLIGSEMERDMVSKTPLGRLGQPQDIAPIAVFLASADSGWLTGEVIVASGGLR